MRPASADDRWRASPIPACCRVHRPDDDRSRRHAGRRRLPGRRRPLRRADPHGAALCRLGRRDGHGQFRPARHRAREVPQPAPRRPQSQCDADAHDARREPRDRRMDGRRGSTRWRAPCGCCCPKAASPCSTRRASRSTIPKPTTPCSKSLEKTVRQNARRKIERVDANINDDEFVSAVVDAFGSIGPRRERRRDVRFPSLRGALATKQPRGQSGGGAGFAFGRNNEERMRHRAWPHIVLPGASLRSRRPRKWGQLDAQRRRSPTDGVQSCASPAQRHAVHGRRPRICLGVFPSTASAIEARLRRRNTRSIRLLLDFEDLLEDDMLLARSRARSQIKGGSRGEKAAIDRRRSNPQWATDLLRRMPRFRWATAMSQCGREAFCQGGPEPHVDALSLDSCFRSSGPAAMTDRDGQARLRLNGGI